MSSMMFYLTILACVAMLDFGFGQTPAPSTCDQLPRLPVPSMKLLVHNSPMPFDYSTAPVYDCAVAVITCPLRSTNLFTGNAIKGSRVFTYDYEVESDNITLTSYVCGMNVTGYFLAYDFTDDGGFYCVYQCNGTALGGLTCSSNNASFLPQEQAAVAMAQAVPNGDIIHLAQQNCTDTEAEMCSYVASALD